ncbi:hypothetical protein [Kitasatospora indigofera]|uniref:hypothetical protein n=1 Tax=Kitasatospora indigofera TaxID=67307 RepID=UPI00367D231B
MPRTPGPLQPVRPVKPLPAEDVAAWAARHPQTGFDGDEAARLAAQLIGPATVLHVTYGVCRITTADGVHVLVADCEAGLFTVRAFQCDRPATAPDCADPDHEWAPDDADRGSTVDLSQDHTLGAAAARIAHAAAALLHTLRST